jgi:hypothetical protein
MHQPYIIEKGYPRTTYKTLKNVRLNYPRFWTRPLLKVKREFVGLDTETVEGKIRVIADSNGDYLTVNNNSIALDKLIDFIMRRYYQGKWITLFNIKYDFDALLKYFPDENNREIYETGKTVYNGYKIKYFPKKWVGISKNRKNVNWFDISQFYKTLSLEKAVEMYLNPSIEELEQMKKLKANRAVLFEKYSQDEIINYCIKDAEYTKRLADIFQEIYIKTFNMNMSKPFSPASLAQTYVKMNCYIPKIRNFPSDLLETAYRAYYGGRMEITQRGTFKSAYKYDINSAYPSIMRDLLNVENGEWKRVRKINENAEYGFYKALVNVNFEDNFILAPLPFRLKGDTIIYPNGEWIGFYSKDELELLDSYKILYGYEFYPSFVNKPFKKYVDTLYKLKVESTDRIQRDLYKMMLNSIYGKFAQTSGGKTGFLFNSIYACLITSKCRRILYNLKDDYNIISYATDSVITNSPINNIKIGEKLGEWKNEVKDKPAIVIQTGVYKIDNQIGERGLPQLWNNLKKSEKEKTIDLIQNRPYSLGESYKLKDFSNLNIFREIQKKCDINGDYKRDWSDDFKNIKDMLNRRISSKAYTVGMSNIPDIRINRGYMQNAYTLEKE